MNDQNQKKLHIKYESMTAVYADHVVLNNLNGAVILDFASAMVGDSGSGDSTIPVHTRIAMTHQGASQLLQLLINTFAPAPSKGGNASVRPEEAADSAGS